MHTWTCGPCGTEASVNAVAQVRQVIPSLRLNTVSNAPPACGFIPVRVPAAVVQEFIDWGGQILTTHLVRLTNVHLPGFAWMHGAWQLRQVVADLRRGHLADAVVRGAPAALALSGLGGALLEAWPGSGGHHARHDAAVLAVAAAVWATGQQEELPSAPPGLAQRALLGSLRILRTVSGMMGASGRHPPFSPPDVCDGGYCVGTTPVPAGSSVTGNQTASLTARGLLQPNPIPQQSVAPATGCAFPFACGFTVLPVVTAKRSSGRGAPPRPARPKAPTRSSMRRVDKGVKVTRNRKRHPAASEGLNNVLEEKNHVVPMRGAARNNAAMAAHAQAANGDGNRDSMMGPLSHSSRVALGLSEAEDRRKAAGAVISTPSPPTLDPRRRRPEKQPPAPPTPLGPPAIPLASAMVPSTTAAATTLPVCLRFHDVRQTCAQLRALREQPDVIRYCAHPRDDEPFITMFRFPGAELPGLGARTIAHPILEDIPEVLRSSAIQVLRRQLHPGPAHLSRPSVVGHHRLYAVVTIALLDSPVDASVETLLTDDPMSLLRNTFRLMEYVDIGGMRHLFIAYLVAQDESGKQGVAAGIVDVEVDDSGRASLKDPRRNWIIGAPDLEALVTSLEDMSGLVFDPGPDRRHADADMPRPIIPEPASNLWAIEEERLSWTPPHARLPYDRSLGFITPVVIPESAHHPAVELYANSFSVRGNSLVYAEDNRSTGVLRFGCPTIQHSSAAIRHCPPGADADFAARFGLQHGYVYNLESLARQLVAGGMVRVPDPDAETEDTGDTALTTTTTPPDTSPESALRCAACFTFKQGILDYKDPHGRQGILRFDAVPGHRQQYLLGDIERAEDQEFVLLNGFNRLGRYTEDAIVQWFIGQGYVRQRVT